MSATHEHRARQSGTPHSLSADELTERNIAVVARLDAAAKAKRTPTDCMVDAITGFCGRMTFVWVHAALFGGWIALNIWPPRADRFDPYPFQFLTLIVSLEAIFLSAFILISQNRQARLAERRNHLDLQINLLAEQENTRMLLMLEAITRHLNIHNADPQIPALDQATEPERLVAQIERFIEGEGRP